MLKDTKCKICKTDLVWQGSFTNGHLACPNQSCVSQLDKIEPMTSKHLRAEELEYDAADD